MNTPRNNREPRNLNRISLAEQWEIDFWITALDTNEHDLRNAIQSVGNAVDKVKLKLSH